MGELSKIVINRAPSGSRRLYYLYPEDRVENCLDPTAFGNSARLRCFLDLLNQCQVQTQAPWHEFIAKHRVTYPIQVPAPPD